MPLHKVTLRVATKTALNSPWTLKWTRPKTLSPASTWYLFCNGFPCKGVAQCWGRFFGEGEREQAPGHFFRWETASCHYTHLSGSNEMSRVNCDTARSVALSPQAPYLSPQMRKTAFSRGPWHTKKQTRTFTLIRKPTQDAEHLSWRLKTRARACTNPALQM